MKFCVADIEIEIDGEHMAYHLLSLMPDRIQAFYSVEHRGFVSSDGVASDFGLKGCVETRCVVLRDADGVGWWLLNRRLVSWMKACEYHGRVD